VQYVVNLAVKTHLNLPRGPSSAAPTRRGAAGGRGGWRGGLRASAATARTRTYTARRRGVAARDHPTASYREVAGKYFLLNILKISITNYMYLVSC
jgi:hypothetical protein